MNRHPSQVKMKYLHCELQADTMFDISEVVSRQTVTPSG